MEESNVEAEGADLGNRWLHNRVANFIKEERPWNESEFFNPLGASSLKIFSDTAAGQLLLNRDEMMRQSLAELCELRSAIDAIYTVLEPKIVMEPWYGIDEPKHKKILRVLPTILNY